MNFSTSRKGLLDALKRVKVANPSSHLAILAGVRVEARKGTVGLTATSLDLTVATDVTAEVSKPGEAVLPAALVERLLAASGADTVTVDVNIAEERVTVATDDKTATLRTLPLAEWPQTPEVEGTRFTFDATDVDRLGRIVHCVSADKERRALTGVRFSPHQAAATDSYRLGIVELDAEIPEVTVPGDVAKRVLAAASDGFGMTVGERWVHFDTPEVSWTSTVLLTEYPNYSRLVRDTSPHDLTVNRAELAAAVRYVKVLADDENTKVMFTRDGDKLLCAATRQDVGDASASVPCAGSWTEAIGFNGGFLADLLDAHDGDDVTFELVDALKLALVRSADRRVTQLIMPVRTI